MIHLHLYAKLADTQVFDQPLADAARVGVVPQGTWLGVVARQGDWARVISHNVEGWVRVEQTEERPPFSLHARWKPGMHPQYFSLAG